MLSGTSSGERRTSNFRAAASANKQEDRARKDAEWRTTGWWRIFALVQVFKSPKESLGDLGAQSAAKLIAAATDVALVVDGQGVIRDVAFNKEELSLELDGHGRWLGSKLLEIVTPDTRDQSPGIAGGCRRTEIVELAPGQPSVARRRGYSGALFGDRYRAQGPFCGGGPRPAAARRHAAAAYQCAAIDGARLCPAASCRNTLPAVVPGLVGGGHDR